MALTRWPYFEDPFRLPEEVLKTFAPLFGATTARSANVFPPVNIYDDGQAFLVRAEMPGVDKDTLDVSVKGDQLTLRGERKPSETGRDTNFHRREREGGQFRRVVTLPQPVDGEKISATYRNGVLEVVLPRVPEAQVRRIAVQ